MGQIGNGGSVVGGVVRGGTGVGKKGAPGGTGVVGGAVGGAGPGSVGKKGAPGGTVVGGAVGGAGQGSVGKKGAPGGGVVGGAVGGGSGPSGGGKKGAPNSGAGNVVGGVVGTGKGGKGKGTVALGDVNQAANQVFNQLHPSAQAWVQTQARAIVSGKHFGESEHRRLLHQASAISPATDPSLVVAMIRFRALQASAGGSVHSLYAKSGGLTTFQNQLIRGGLI